MSPWRTVIWSRSWLVFAVGLGLGVAIVTQLTPSREPYGPGLVGGASAAWAYTLVALSGVAAWNARLAAAFLINRPSRRSRLFAVLRLTWPLPVAAVLAEGVLLVAYVVRSGQDLGSLFTPVVGAQLGVTAIEVVALFSIATVAGVGLPLAVGPPLLALATWLWLTMPLSLEPVWLRQLTGSQVLCCEISVMPDPWALSAAAVTGLTWVMLGALALARSRAGNGTADLLRAVGMVTAGVLAGTAVATSHGGASEATMTVARSDRLVCSESDPQVCLWPEHSGNLERVEQLTNVTFDQWRQLGIPVPPLVSERGDGFALGYSPQQTDTNLVRVLAGLVTATASVPRESCASDDAALAQVRREDTVKLVLALSAGVPAAELAQGGLLPADVEQAEVVVRERNDSLGPWFAAEAAALVSCTS